MAEIALLVASTAVSAAGQISAGAAAERDQKTQAAQELASAQFEAEQQRRIAQTERATGSARAREKRRESRRLQSSLIARAAASGAGVRNATVFDLIEDAEERGELEAGFEQFQGEDSARRREDQADLRLATGQARARLLRQRGKAARRESFFKAAGTLLDGASSFQKIRAKKKATTQPTPDPPTPPPLPTRNPRR